MPTHTIASAIIKLHTLGIPWDYPVWQAATGVKHGLFPEDPKLLPKGWTPEDASNIASYFDQYRAKPTEDEKIAFVSQRRGTALPGRKKWRDWINAIWRSAGIHDKIIAVIAANNCHPLSLSFEQTEDASSWPMGAIWLPVCLDAIAVELFGDECLDAMGRLPERFRAPTQALAQRTWTNLTKRLDRSKKRFAIYEQEALEAFNDLDDETLTRAKITTVIRAVAKWRNAAELLNTPENIEKIEKMEVELERLMEGLGAQVSKKKTKTKKTPAPQLFKLSKEMLRSLASEQAVQDIILLYREFFDNPLNAADDVPLVDRQKPIQIPFGDSVDGADTGAEYEAKIPPKALATNLGFVDRIPLLFNMHRRTDGLTPWSNPEAFQFQRDPPAELENLELHWHQLAGVHAIIRACFTPEPLDEHCAGVLVADEVGLGKTYQSATVIAFLADAVIRQVEELTVAPLLESRPYLIGEKKIPCLPHLILVPGTLLAQWLDELHILFAPGAVDLFTYPTSKEEREMFWAPDGPFHSSNHDLSNRIILAPHSALQKDFQSLYLAKSKTSGALPWTTPPLLPLNRRANISKTLFGQCYLSTTLDEAHHFRNHGAKHSAALAILGQTTMRLVLTATPLQTATKDLAAMGRLTGIPYFLTEAAFHDEKEDMRNLRRARKDLPDDYDPLEENDEDPIKLCQVVIAQRMQQQSQGHILRRTIDSKNWKGKALVPLPPCTTIYGYLDLTAREVTIITANGQSLKDSVGTANTTLKLFTRGFYMEYRISVIYAREHPDDDIPVFKSLDQWELVKSTKLDTAARLCSYFLKRDNLALPTFADGTVHYPPIPQLLEGETVTQDCKIVVFTEFPSMSSLLLNIFQLYGIKVLAVNGSMSYEKRASVIKKFREDPTYRVLALSSVGTTGINLAFCRIIIFL
ncbi:P-loop containing nucleoside triphosphate hydrolase protein, partial [Flammula alnicola]